MWRWDLITQTPASSFSIDLKNDFLKEQIHLQKQLKAAAVLMEISTVTWGKIFSDSETVAGNCLHHTLEG